MTQPESEHSGLTVEAVDNYVVLRVGKTTARLETKAARDIAAALITAAAAAEARSQ